jgi:hypothetical protein
MDINAQKLKRIVSHIENDGVVSPESIAKILKAQPKNTGYLRSYVEAACTEIGDTSALVEFDSKVGQAEETPATEQPAPVVAHEPAPEQPAPAEVVAKLGPEQKDSNFPTRATPGSVAYVLIDENGLMKPLEVKTQTASKVILTVAKEKKEVKVILRGQEVVVDLLDLKPVVVGAVTFSAEQLEVIAQAAAV